MADSNFFVEVSPRDYADLCAVATAGKIFQVLQAVEELAPSPDELRMFENYLARAENGMAGTDPTRYVYNGKAQIEAARRRVDVIKRFHEVLRQDAEEVHHG